MSLFLQVRVFHGLSRATHVIKYRNIIASRSYTEITTLGVALSVSENMLTPTLCRDYKMDPLKHQYLCVYYQVLGST